jgi:hypothetical protein
MGPDIAVFGRSRFCIWGRGWNRGGTESFGEGREGEGESACPREGCADQSKGEAWR